MMLNKPMTFAFLENFYDRGLREGDLFLIEGNALDDLNNLKRDDVELYDKVKVFYTGAFLFSQSAFVGEIG